MCPHIMQNRMTGHGRGASRRQWVRWRVVGSGEPSEGLMPFIDSSRDSQRRRKGPRVRELDDLSESQLASSVQNDGAVSEDHLTVI